jgi:hypothetical protein
MELKYFSETSVDFQRTTRRYITEDRTLHSHHCENLTSYTTLFLISFVGYLMTRLVPWLRRSSVGRYDVLWMRIICKEAFVAKSGCDPSTCLERLKGTTNNLNQCRRWSDRDSNQKHPEHKSRTFISRPACSVIPSFTEVIYSWRFFQ